MAPFPSTARALGHERSESRGRRTINRCPSRRRRRTWSPRRPATPREGCSRGVGDVIGRRQHDDALRAAEPGVRAGAVRQSRAARQTPRGRRHGRWSGRPMSSNAPDWRRRSATSRPSDNAANARPRPMLNRDRGGDARCSGRCANVPVVQSSHLAARVGVGVGVKRRPRTRRGRRVAGTRTARSAWKGSRFRSGAAGDWRRSPR